MEIDRNEFIHLVLEKNPTDVFEVFATFEYRGYLTSGGLRAALGALSVDLKSSETKALISPLGFVELVSRKALAQD